MKSPDENLMEGPEDDLGHEFLSRCFQLRLGCDDVRVRELIKFPRGVSRETWFVTCEVVRGAQQTREDFVLRRDLPGGSICLGDLHSEYEIYRRLNDSGVPVAETLWYEDDSDVLEGRREFFVRRHVEGDWDIPHITDPDHQYNDLRVEIGRELVRKLALVHTCDWQALGFDEVLRVPPTSKDCAPYRIHAITQEIAKLQVQPLPLVTEAAEWFLDNQPPDSGQVCLIKGTNGYGEEIFRGHEIVAMSDWEICCLGDPAMDFALAQGFLSEVKTKGSLVWGLQPALDYYQELTGIVVHPQAVDYYKRLYGFYRIQYSQAAADQLQAGSPLCRLAWVSVEVLQLGLTVLADTIGCVNQDLPEMGQQ